MKSILTLMIFVCVCTGFIGCGSEVEKTLTVKQKIIGSWGVGMDYDDKMYAKLMKDATPEVVDGLNAAIDRYTSISLQVEFIDDGSYKGVMNDSSSGTEVPIEGTWEITTDGEMIAKMNISHGPPKNPGREVVEVEFRNDDLFRTPMFGMPQEVKGMFFWTYSKNKT